MDTTLIGENDFKSNPEAVPPTPLFFFKMVAIGPDTVKQVAGNPADICDRVRDVQGWFLLTDDLRSEMHSLVDRFVDAVEANK